MSISAKWTKEQIKTAMEVILMRLEANEDSFRTEQYENTLTFRNHDTFLTINLYSEERRIYLGTNTHEGPCFMSGLFWKDKDIKLLRKKLIDYKKTFAANKAAKDFFKVFPEAINKEFNKEVLDHKPKS